MSKLSDSAAWSALAQHADKTRAYTLNRRFAEQERRAEALTTATGPLSINFSRQHVDAQTLSLLKNLAEQQLVFEKLNATMTGELVNNTEQRKACHNALRSSSPPQDVSAMLASAKQFVEDIHSGKLLSATGEPFTHVINIGIGGSDLGPKLIVDTLRGLHAQKLECHFLANIDPSALSAAIRDCPAQTTLVLVSSKSFGTEETKQNALAIFEWLKTHTGEGYQTNLLAISSQPEKAKAFGIDRCIAFPGWVGGRFSVWSAIGLPVALAYGFEVYTAMLRGGESIDQDLSTNNSSAAIVCGLIDVWNRNFCKRSAVAILPYAERLRLLPDYLQQLFMESQGKQVAQDGSALDYETGMVLFGSQGTNGQHSFHQLIHQGSDIIPCDFLLPLNNADAVGDQHERLIANCLGQSLALMTGQTTEAIASQLNDKGGSEAHNVLLAAHKTMPGNRPSTIISFDRVDAYTLGAIIAFYEYRMMTAAFLWDINPFDQWGVELGKVTSQSLLPHIKKAELDKLDPVSAKVLAGRK